MKYYVISPDRDFQINSGMHTYRTSEEAVLDMADENDYVHVVEVTTFSVVTTLKLKELN